MAKKEISISIAMAMMLAGGVPAAYAEQVGSVTTSVEQAVYQPEGAKQPVLVDGTVLESTFVASMTDPRTMEFHFEVPEGTTLDDITWTFGDKALEEWKIWSKETKTYDGESFITFESKPVLQGNTVKGTIKFNLLYNTADLTQDVRRIYPETIGTYSLTATLKDKPLYERRVKLVPYDSFHTYEEIKPAVDQITAKALDNRYIETHSLGQSAEGRDIYFSVVAKDQASVDQYMKETLPLMKENPALLQEKVKNGELGNYKIPIWINNIHPDEAPGIDAILNLLEGVATKNSITYDTKDAEGKETKVTLNVDEALDNVIFLLNYTENPDGRVHNTRANANGLDLNRDNSYQTQPETKIVASEIAKWSPLSFLDLHGFVTGFLIEPCTPPHDPNLEYDLLMDNMLEQASLMGDAGIANTKYESYFIPYEEHQKTLEDPSYKSDYATGWDDLSPAYTAVFAMHHGALGHTIEIPEMNEDSVDALYYATLAATKYVSDHKDQLFLNQLEIYKRGLEGVDSSSVDSYLINAKNEEIGRPRMEGESFFPDYYVLPVDPSLQENPLEVYQMVEYLLRNDVKVDLSTEEVVALGKTYPAGSYIVDMKQAKRGFANLVLYDGVDVSDYDAMYAEIVQNFAELRGFERYTLYEEGAFTGKLNKVTSVTIPKTDVTANAAYYVIRSSNNDAIKAVNDLLAQKKNVQLLTAGGKGYELGDYLVSAQDLKAIKDKYYLEVVPLTAPAKGKILTQTTVAAVGNGQTTFALKELGFSISKDQNKAGVIVDDNGNADYDLVKSGKPYIAYGGIALNKVSEAGIWPEFKIGRTGNSHEGLFKAELSQKNSVTAPYEAADYLYTASGAWIETVPTQFEVIAQISDEDDFMLTGWWPEHEKAKGRFLGIATKQDNTKDNPNAVLFANNLVNRNHTQHQYRIVGNAIFTTVSEQTPVTVTNPKR